MRPKHFKPIDLMDEVKAATKLTRKLSTKLRTMPAFSELLKDQDCRDDAHMMTIELRVLAQAMKSFAGSRRIRREAERKKQ
jgi:hypothetical protein